MAKVVFFAPHTAIWRHAFPEALVAEAFMQAGHDVTYVTCGEQFNGYCVAMSAFGLKAGASPEEKRKICAKCNQHKGILKSSLGLRGFDLSEKVTDDAHREVERLLAELRPDNFLELRLGGLEVARLALYEFLLEHKKRNLDFSDAEWAAYQTVLRNSLYAYFAGVRLLDEVRPDKVLVYNSLYSVNRVFVELAKSRGIPAFFLHAGGNLSNRLQTLMFGRESTLSFWKSLTEHWESLQAQPLAASSLSYVTDHFMALLEGRNVFAYSAPKQAEAIDVRGRFGIRPDQKVLVATMSSYDERFAAEFVGALRGDYELVFPQQVDWIRALIAYVKERDDLALIVRVHPREFPNKREGVMSEHARLLERELVDLPPNVKVNWPTDQLSLYDLAEHTDVFLSAWSSVGKEMCLLGLPVVLYSPDLVFYPASLNYVGTTQAAYFEQVEQALRDGWSLENVRKAYRWYALEFGTATVSIADSCTMSETPPTDFLSRARRSLESRLFPYHRMRSDCRKRAPRLKEAAVLNAVLLEDADSPLGIAEPRPLAIATQEEETRAVKTELARLYGALYGARSQALGERGLSYRLRQAIQS